MTRSEVELRGRLKGFWAGRWEINREEDLVATLVMRMLRERCTIEADGVTVEGERSGLMKPVYTLKNGERTIARVRKTSAVRTRYALDLGGAEITIRQTGWTGRQFLVSRGDEQIGSVRRRGWWGRHAEINLPPEWPLGLKIFVFWIIALAWRRQDAAAAS
jgi:hypothetical protein